MRAIETYSEESMKDFVSKPTKDFYVNFMMWTTKFGDRTAIMLGGLPLYSYHKEKAMKEGKTEEEAKAYAIRKFERSTKQTQQSGDLQDKDLLQTSNPVVRALNMFLTTPKQYLRKEIIASRALYRKVKAWDKNAGKGTVRENVRSLLMYHVYMPLFFQYIAMGLPGLLRGWRDDDDEDLARAAIIGNLNALFLVGEVFAGWGDFFTDKPWAGTGGKQVGMLQMSNALIKKLDRARTLKDPVKKAKAYNDFLLELGTLSSLPLPTIDKFIQNYSKIGSDEDMGKDILRFLNFSEYQIEGSKNKKKEKSEKTILELNKEYQKKMEKESKKKEVSLMNGR